MKEYQQNFAISLADSGSLFMDDKAFLKDGRPACFFVSTGKYNSGQSLCSLGEFYADMLVQNGMTNGIDVLFGPSYKGSSIAAATAMSLWNCHQIDLKYEYDRKEAKAHGDASKSKSMFVTGAFKNDSRVYLLDDVVSSAATKYETLAKIENEADRRGWNIPVVGLGISVDREQAAPVYGGQMPDDVSDQELAQWKKQHVQLEVKGKDAIAEFTRKTGVRVDSIVGIRDVINFLFEARHPLIINGERRMMTDEDKDIFDSYMFLYGVDR